MTSSHHPAALRLSSALLILAVCASLGCPGCPVCPATSTSPMLCVRSVAATPLQQRADGTPWDEDGTGPDVVVAASGQVMSPEYVEGGSVAVPCAATPEDLAAQDMFVAVLDEDDEQTAEVLPMTSIPVTAQDVAAGQLTWLGSGVVRELEFRLWEDAERTRVELVRAVFEGGADGGPFTRHGAQAQLRVDARCRLENGALYGWGPVHVVRDGTTPLCALANDNLETGINLRMFAADEWEPMATWRQVRLPPDGIRAGRAQVPGWEGVAQLEFVVEDMGGVGCE